MIFNQTIMNKITILKNNWHYSYFIFNPSYTKATKQILTHSPLSPASTFNRTTLLWTLLLYWPSQFCPPPLHTATVQPEGTTPTPRFTPPSNFFSIFHCTQDVTSHTQYILQHIWVSICNKYSFFSIFISHGLNTRLCDLSLTFSL